MQTRIICLGNELVRDDGIGIRVGRVLASLPLPADTRVEEAPHLGWSLLDVVAQADRLILVDAMSTGQAPGTCVTMQGQAIARYNAGAAASHTLSIAELMELALRLAPGRTPASLHFVGIEGVVFDTYGTQLTPEVRDAIPAAVEAVLRLLDASPELLQAGREASQRAQAEPLLP